MTNHMKKMEKKAYLNFFIKIKLFRKFKASLFYFEKIKYKIKFFEKKKKKKKKKKKNFF